MSKIDELKRRAEALPTDWPYGADLKRLRFHILLAPNCWQHEDACVLAHALHVRGAAVYAVNVTVHPPTELPDVRTIPAVVVEAYRQDRDLWRPVYVHEIDDHAPLELPGVLDRGEALDPIVLYGLAQTLRAEEDAEELLCRNAQARQAEDEAALADLLDQVDQAASVDEIKAAVKASLLRHLQRRIVPALGATKGLKGAGGEAGE